MSLTIPQIGFDLPRHTSSLINRFRTGQGPCRANLWPATDLEPHCRQVPLNKIWRRTESTPRSGWLRSHMARIYSDCCSAVFFCRPRSDGWPHQDVLSPFISVLCHTIRDTRCYFNVRSKADISQLNLPHGSLICRSVWLFHGESCPRLDVVHPGLVWSSSPACTWHCSLHYLFLRATPLFSHGVTIVC